MPKNSPEAKERYREKRRQRRRSDAEFKAKEQNENTSSHRERRSDPIIQEEEQIANTIRHREHRDIWRVCLSVRRGPPWGKKMKNKIEILHY